MSTKQTFDVLIIGGGVIGLSIMRELLHYRLSVGLLERHDDVCNEVSKANSGIIHAGFDDRNGSMRARFSPHGSLLFEKLDAELHFGYRKIGSLVLARTDVELELLNHLRAKGEKNGVRDLSILDPPTLYQKEPNLEHGFTGALFAPESGVVSPYEFGIALAENSLENGGSIHLGENVRSIECSGGPFAVHTDTATYTARLLINAAGLYADKVSSMLGCATERIIPRKGAYIVFNRGTGDSIKHVLFRVPGPKGKGILITPTFHGNLLIGPNAVDGVSKTDVSTNKEELQALMAHAQQVLHKIPQKLAIRSFAGVRPLIARNDFCLQEPRPRFFECSGITSPGLTAAPKIAQFVREEFIQKHLKLEENPNFNPFRHSYTTPQFKRDFLPAKEASAEARRDLSDPLCMVCRCEQVRKKTIDKALSAGIPIHNTDAIKRRTRAGLGFCQGKFCRPRVATLIAEHKAVKGLNYKQDSKNIPVGDSLEPEKPRVSSDVIRKLPL